MGRPSNAVGAGSDAPLAIHWQSSMPVGVLLFVILGTLVAVWWAAPHAALTSLIDALASSVVLAPAILFGHALLRCIRLAPLPARWRFIYSAALGLGFLSVLVLIAGLLGLLNRTLWLGILAGMSLVGVLSLRGEGSNAESPPRQITQETVRAHPAWNVLWIVAAPFLTLALLAASNPPGMIWQEEGNGYDVLEYHLQLPREYFQAGAIEYIPHNVYANFPANMEMLYLLAMVIHDDVRDLGTTANMIHLAFAVLTVFAAWALGRDISPHAGIVGGLAVATCTWLEYLSGLAYVENGMLFFGICALAATIRVFDRAAPALSWPILAGLSAGLAAGCKYTAIPMIVMPLAVVWLFQRNSWSRRFIHVGTFCLFAVLAVLLWLTKNWMNTGNPVFPLANEWFSISAPQWSNEQTIQWNRAHAADGVVGVSDRLGAWWQMIPADHEQRFGPAILALGLLGLFARSRSRMDGALIALLLIQTGVWLFATHLYARFAIPMILPLGVLACRALPYGASSRRCFVAIAVLIAGAAWNFNHAARRHARESAPGAPASLFYDGKLPGFEYLDVVNHELPPDSHLLLVGDARPFYIVSPADYCVAFNRNPLFEKIQGPEGSRGALEWIRENNYTHLLIHWNEVRRIARTYRFSPSISADQLSTGLREMTESGLRLVRSFPHPSQPRMRYIELYEVVSTSN